MQFVIITACLKTNRVIKFDPSSLEIHVSLFMEVFMYETIFMM